MNHSELVDRIVAQVQTVFQQHDVEEHNFESTLEMISDFSPHFLTIIHKNNVIFVDLFGSKEAAILESKNHFSEHLHNDLVKMLTDNNRYDILSQEIVVQISQ